jgi:hypothetical protein
MTQATFSLTPFPDSKIPVIEISGSVDRKDNIIIIHYSLTGHVEDVLFPPVTSRPSRKDDLWKATCLEFFLALPHDPQYWEFNMSPSGDWNIYHMDAYRQVGLREESLIQQLPFSLHCEQDFVSVDARVDLDQIVSADQEIQVGITCVIQSRDGHETYWALTHPHAQADFHVREGFALTLTT